MPWHAPALLTFCLTFCLPLPDSAAQDGSAPESPAIRIKPEAQRRPKQRSADYREAPVADGGTIEGVVLYTGEVPSPRKIQVVKDQDTCDHREKLEPRIKINDAGRVEEAVVFLGDITSGKPLPQPTGQVIVDQKLCTFIPHVQVVLKGQPFEVVNSDPIAHSAHFSLNRRTVYNRMQPKQGMRSEVAIDDVGLATLKCDVHDWMRAYLYVLPHGYFAVTGPDGRFSLGDVPAGRYELVVWQESLGEYTTVIEVGSGATVRLELELTRE